MRILPLVLLSLFSLSCFSQNNELLRSRGSLPGNITGSAQQIAASEIQKRKSRHDTIPADEFRLINNTADLCERIAKSGRLLINDTMSAYANKILDILLKDDPELRKKLCVYFYYSEGTNAVTLNNGMIIVEMGLMAHIQNEAQLAFILSHEICHFRENHFLKSYRYSRKKKDEDDPLSEILRYSRSLEQEADSLGFLIYKKSGYALSEAVTAFEMLKKSDMPEEQIPFNVSFFEHGQYHFPEDYTADTIYPVTKNDIEETLSTHPSCDRRMENIRLLLAGLESRPDLFLISENTFHALRLIAREECCAIYLEERDYGNAIYCSYELLMEDSTNELASRILGKGLYNIAAYSVSDEPIEMPDYYIIGLDYAGDFSFSGKDDFSAVVDYQNVPGEGQKMNYFLSEMSNIEKAVLALDWNWKLYSKTNYKDPLLKKMCDNLMIMINVYNDNAPSDFLPSAINKRVIGQTDSVKYVPHMVIDSVTVSKVMEEYHISEDLAREKIQDAIYTKEDNTKPEHTYYVYRCFDEILSDSLFYNLFEDSDNKSRFSYDSPNDMKIVSDKNKKSNYGCGIRNIYILPPSYYRLREIKRTRTYKYDPDGSKKLQYMAQAVVSGSAKAAKSNYDMLSPQVMDSISVSDYNNYCLLRQWVSERNAHGSNLFALNLAHSEVMDSLTTRLGVNYVMTSIIICEKQKRIRHMGSFVLACITPWTLPLALVYGIIPRNHSEYQSLVYDLHTGKLMIYYEEIKKSKAGNAQMSVYYTKVFQRLSKKKAPNSN